MSLFTFCSISMIVFAFSNFIFEWIQKKMILVYSNCINYQIKSRLRWESKEQQTIQKLTFWMQNLLRQHEPFFSNLFFWIILNNLDINNKSKMRTKNLRYLQLQTLLLRSASHHRHRCLPLPFLLVLLRELLSRRQR